MIAIECSNVEKHFDKVTALDGVTFQVAAGSICALLGRNGAGKTTLMNCICTKYLQDAGGIQVLGEPVYENERVLKKLCFLKDEMEAFDLKRVNKLLSIAKHFYPEWDEVLEQKLLDFFGINQKSTYAALSKGQKTVVSIIIGLCSGCEVVLFDEIYAGLDAVAREQFYDILLKEQEKKPRTFVLSTHLIEEMSAIFTDVVILDKGRVLLSADMETVHDHAYKLMGRGDQESLLQGKNVLLKQAMGTLAEYDVYDSFTKEEQRSLEEQGFQFSALSLQELFVAMTTDEVKEWGDGDGTD